MEKLFFEPDRSDADGIAEKLFTERTGLNREGSKYARMKDDAFGVLGRIEGSIRPAGECARFDSGEFTLSGDVLVLAGTELRCRAFELIDADTVCGAFLYVCTAGDYAFPEWNIMDQYYADAWGGAYVDAVRFLLEREIRDSLGEMPDAKGLGESFGPGFYGMEIGEVHKFAGILDFDSLGLRVNKNGIILPTKSCTGIFFAVNGDYGGVGAECRSCLGNHESCRLCKVSPAGSVRTL